MVGQQPFAGCSNPLTYKHITYYRLFVKNLNKYLGKLTKRVAKINTVVLPDKFSLVCHGWTTVDTHYLSVFYTFYVPVSSGYKKILLALSPFESEDDLGASEHFEFVGFAL